jgi:hypothetical protein
MFRCVTDLEQTIVTCSEANEAFHGQLGFTVEGSMMVLQHTGQSKVADDS